MFEIKDEFFIEHLFKDAKNYRKKPLTIQAVQTKNQLMIHTLEGNMLADKGDYIIKGIKGEYYPCKPEIFEQSYEDVESE